jgi:hypothetical protein
MVVKGSLNSFVLAWALSVLSFKRLDYRFRQLGDGLAFLNTEGSPLCLTPTG